MLTTFIRTFIMYTFVVMTLRVIGKKQLSDFEPSELVVTIMMSEVAAMPVQDNFQPLFSSIIVILLLLVFEVAVSFTAFKSPKARKVIYGYPSVFFERGKINTKEMEKQRFSVTDLMESIRNNGYASLSEVEYVIMETNGNISVIPSNTELSYVLIDRGSVYERNLKRLGFDANWLKAELKKKNISSIKEVFYLSADKSGNTFLMKQEDRKK